MRYIHCLLFFILFSSQSLFAQLELFGDFKKIDIPFEFKNQLIIVEVELNRMFPLKFIFDTGAENTILAKKEITDILKVPYEREFKLLGSDMSTELTAFLVRNIHFKMHDMVMPAHSMLVLEEDYFRFEEVAGIEVHGILGADVFRNFVVRINYEREVITLLRRQNFNPPKDGYQKLKIEVNRSKPYFKTDIKIHPDTTLNVKLLLDSGSMLGFLVNTNTDSSLHLPPNVLNGKLGAGLGGYLEGYVGRVHELNIGKHQFNELITHFQDLSESIDTSLLNGRNGILGNQILSKFYVILDYPKEELYLKPNRKFKKKIKFDKSGLVLIATDIKLNSYIVYNVIPDSPAGEAGVLPEDKVKKINGIPTSLLSLNNINKILSKREGKKIKLTIKRGKKKMKVQFVLRKLI